MRRRFNKNINLENLSLFTGLKTFYSGTLLSKQILHKFPTAFKNFMYAWLCVEHVLIANF